jgi:hypothetical protein
MTKKVLFSALFAAFVLCIFSCIKHPIEAPPLGGDIVTNIVGNITVAEVKALHPVAGVFNNLTEDKILKATVIADDRSGNFYKSITIQDATGGIEILVNRSNLSFDFPAGREIYIKLQGLVLGDYNGLFQIGGYVFDSNGSPSLEGILSTQISAHILKGELNKPITPRTTTIAALSKADWQTLVTLTGVEFSKADTGKYYADYIGKASASSVLESCDGKTVDVRTSGYATFAANKKPAGKGTLTCVVGAYNNKPQLLMRDVAEVVMNDVRCGGTTNPGTGNLTLMTIADLRAVFANGGASGPVDKKIKGTVISDYVAKNINGLNMIIQDATGGILVRFTGAHTFALGDVLEINVSGVELSEFSKVLQLNVTPNGNAVKISSGGTIVPRIATVAEIKANQDTWESTLVQVKNATISNTAGTFKGSSTIDDGSATIPMFTATGALFANTALPTGQKTITAIVSDYSTGNQLSIRNTTDIQ